MHARWLNPVVGLFWLAMMTWLVTQKVLPPLLTGEPPSYRAIVRESKEQRLPESSTWRLLWSGREIGWATTRVTIDPDDLTEMINQVHFDDLPVDEMSPLRIGSFIKSGGRERLALDAVTRISIDPLGHLEQFHSSLDFAGIPQAVVVRGNVENNELKLSIRSGEFSYPTKCYLPPNALVGDVLSPQDRLPNLRVGQSWTVPIFSPFSMPGTPMQILKAHVVRMERMEWDDRLQQVFVVEYRGDEGSGLRKSRDTTGEVWVSLGGLVLMQEVQLLGGRLRSVRLAPSELKLPEYSGVNGPTGASPPADPAEPSAAPL